MVNCKKLTASGKRTEKRAFQSRGTYRLQLFAQNLFYYPLVKLSQSRARPERRGGHKPESRAFNPSIAVEPRA